MRTARVDTSQLWLQRATVHRGSPLGAVGDAERSVRRALYDAMRARGLADERALRGLAYRLLACLISTLRHDQLYDPEYRARRSTTPQAA